MTTAPIAANVIAKQIMQGFDKHYRLFREISAEAKTRFERADWHAAANANRDRIYMYDRRVEETVTTLRQHYPQLHNEQIWQDIKAAYIHLLLHHHQPECAETFFNSVACRLLHRSYYRNEFIFWRPTVATEHLEGEEPIYRSYYPNEVGLQRCLLNMVQSYQLQRPFRDLRGDLRRLLQAFSQYALDNDKLYPNYHFQVLHSLFFRNKGAYIVGRELNGYQTRPFVISILQDSEGKLFIDAMLTDPQDLSLLFSFSRAYFMVDMEVPSGYVQFLRTLLPRKPKVEIYSMLGLQKHGKTLFYRDLFQHFRHSTDQFCIASGIRGMVMLVFTLPSYPFVFKIIKDIFEKPKESNRDEVKEKYQLVKNHDRVGRLADTLEYSNVTLPLSRVDPELLQELQQYASSLLHIEGNELTIRHVYIERRMVPLNEYLASASSEARHGAVYEYGQAIRDLVGANIFPGDMMLKNFGVTHHDRVVFYDYDEIEYITDCRFRRVPPSTGAWDDLSADPLYSVEKNDVFPEQFENFFFHDEETRNVFLEHHRDLIDPAWWKQQQRNIHDGVQADVFPYRNSSRFL